MRVQHEKSPQKCVLGKPRTQAQDVTPPGGTSVISPVTVPGVPALHRLKLYRLAGVLEINQTSIVEMLSLTLVP